jgi:hypothetical protein
MAIKNNFEKATFEENLQRLEKLTPDTKVVWGKMNVAQILAHINVGYDATYGDYPVATGLKKLFLKLVVKGAVTGEKPYQKNGGTAPNFIIEDQRDFENEKAKLKAFMEKTFELGQNHFEGKESVSFGAMNAKEWSNQFQKHLNHHFKQFGV